MGFLLVKPGKVEQQFIQLNHLSSQLQQRKQNLQKAHHSLAVIQHDFACTLSKHAAAHHQLAPRGVDSIGKVGVSRTLRDTLGRMQQPDSQEAQATRQRDYENNAQTIDLLISKIDSQAALVSLMKNQIVKPRLFRGKSTAQLMAGIRQQAHVLELEVDKATGSIGLNSKALVDENFKLQNEFDRMQRLIGSMDKLRDSNEPRSSRRGVGLGRWR